MTGTHKAVNKPDVRKLELTHARDTHMYEIPSNIVRDTVDRHIAYHATVYEGTDIVTRF